METSSNGNTSTIKKYITELRIVENNTIIRTSVTGQNNVSNNTTTNRKNGSNPVGGILTLLLGGGGYLGAKKYEKIE